MTPVPPLVPLTRRRFLVAGSGVVATACLGSLGACASVPVRRVTPVNGRIELNKIAGSKVNAALFATNLLNKHYVSGRYVLTGQVGFMSDIPGQPRFWGFELSYNY